MRKLYKVQLLKMTTFREGKFTVDARGTRYECTCENKNTEWDKLYDHMMDTFTIAATEVGPNQLLVYEIY